MTRGKNTQFHREFARIATTLTAANSTPPELPLRSRKVDSHPSHNLPARLQQCNTIAQTAIATEPPFRVMV
jgi:hypothetical protein